MDLRSKLTLDGSDFSKTMNEAAGQVNDFSKKTEDANKAVGDMGKASKKTASELLQQMKSMEGLGRSSSNYRQQLGQISKQIQDLTINYRSMSTEMKNSDFGREVAAKLDELKTKAAEYKDAIMDAQNSVKLLASDTANLDAAKLGLQGLSAGMTLVASAGILGADSTEKMVKVMARLKTIEAATNAVLTIANVLNKDSILMLKIKEIQTRACTRAQTQYTAATGAATVAQRLFNTVAKANPYVLLATAILAVVGALTIFSNDVEESGEVMAEYETEAEKMRKANDKLAENMGKTAGSMIAQFKTLQTEWGNLSTEMEKTEFIEKNADKFEDLGIKIESVEDAEMAFTKKSGVIMQAFILRAKAAAAAALATERYQEALTLREKARNNQFKAGDKIPEDWSQADKQYYSDWGKADENGNYYFADIAVQEANAKYLSDAIAAERKADDLIQEQIADMQELNDLIATESILLDENNNKKTNNGSGGSGGGSGKTSPEVGSAAYYDNIIAEQNKKLREQVHTDEERLEIEQMITRATMLRDRALGKNTDPGIQLKSITIQDVLDREYNKTPTIPAKIQVDEIEFPDVTFHDMNKGIGDAINGLGTMNNAVRNLGSAVEALNEGWDDEKSLIENVTGTISNVMTVMQSITSIIQTMNTLSEIMTGLSMTQWMLEKKKNSEKMKGLVYEQAETATKGTNATLGVIEAITAVIKSASEIPMVGWILGLAAVAGVIALIASAPKFAKGGIVPGSSFGGDNVTAQVNSGEMILNTNQQRRLFDMLDGKSSVGAAGGKVEFVIKGQELKGVLNNYDKKLSRI